MPPRKERPAALSESILRAKLAVEQAPNDLGGGMPEEIPVHNTFIQFGAPPGSLPKEKPLSTAPAWIGPSFQSMMQAAMESSVQAPSQAPVSDPDAAAQAETGAGGSESALQDLPVLASPKKVPVMRYSMTTSSARAAGLPEFGSVATVKPDFLGGNTLDKMEFEIRSTPVEMPLSARERASSSGSGRPGLRNNSTARAGAHVVRWLPDKRFAVPDGPVDTGFKPVGCKLAPDYGSNAPRFGIEPSAFTSAAGGKEYRHSKVKTFQNFPAHQTVGQVVFNNHTEHANSGACLTDTDFMSQFPGKAGLPSWHRFV